MIKNAQKNITLVTTKDGLERKHDCLYAPLKKASLKGVKVKIAVPSAVGKEVLNRFSKIAEVKHTKDNTRFCMVDDKELLLMLTEDKKTHKDYDCAVWVDASYFVNYLAKLFDNEWSNLR